MRITLEDKAAILKVLDKYLGKQSSCFSFFCKDKKNLNRSQKGWKNFSENIAAADALVIDINDRKTLVAVHNAIVALNKDKSVADMLVMRVAAGGKHNQDLFNETNEYSQSYSLTDCAAGNIIFRLVGDEFQKIANKDKTNRIVTMGAGVQIWDLHNTIYDQFGYVLQSAPLLSYMTFVGLAANCGHGTGLNAPALCELIQSMEVLMPNGEIKIFKEGDPEFSAMRGSNLGAFGIILSVDIKCIEAKKLLCRRDACNLYEFKEKVKNGLFFNHERLSVMWVPHYDGNTDGPDAENNIVLMHFEPQPLTTPDKNYPAKGLHTHFGQEVMMNISEVSKELSVAHLLSQNPELIPIYMRAIVSKIEIGEDTESLGPWPRIWHYMTAYPHDISDDDYLFAVKVNGNEISRAVEAVDSLLKKYAQHGKYSVIDAMYLRVFKGTNGGLSTSYHAEDEYICGFDVVSNDAIPGYKEFRRDLKDFFMNELKARPHWGKSIPADADFNKIYGDNYPQFIATLQKYYADCGLTVERSPYLNPFLNHILKAGLALQEEKVSANQVAIIPQSAKVYKDTPVKQLQTAQNFLDQIKEDKTDAVQPLKAGLENVILQQKVKIFEAEESTIEPVMSAPRLSLR